MSAPDQNRNVTPDWTCWYDRPAADWNSALPLGNGAMGAMSFGGNVAARIQLTCASLWYGGFRARVTPDARAHLPTLRQLIREGRIQEAEERGYDRLKERHRAAFSARMDRCSLTLTGSSFDHLPTDQRIQRGKEGNTDLSLAALSFAYGRYLLLSSRWSSGV